MFYIQIYVYILQYFNYQLFSDDLNLILFVLNIFVLQVSFGFYLVQSLVLQQQGIFIFV